MKPPERRKPPGSEGDYIAANDLAMVSELPFDVMVEATGRPVAAARHAMLAIEAEKHIALVTKELDSVVGPGLKKLAADRGRVVTTVDGDQPSLLIGLISWAEVLGFDLIAAGKSSEYDFVFDASTGHLESNENPPDCSALAAHWTLGSRATSMRSSRRGERLRLRFPSAPFRTCASSWSLRMRPGFSRIGRISTPPSPASAKYRRFFPHREGGGILSGERRLDVFHCLRTADEISFAGGVFVVIRCDDAKTWEMLAQKGHIVSRTGATAMVFMPRHLLGLEAATSILDAAIHNVSGYGNDYRPRFDLVAVATQDLPAGMTAHDGRPSSHHRGHDRGVSSGTRACTGYARAILPRGGLPVGGVRPAG